MEVGQGGDELRGDGRRVDENLVADGEVSDLSCRHVGDDVGLEPGLGGSGARGDNGDGFGWDADYELDVRVGEGLHDRWVGVVDLDIAERGGEKQVGDFLRGWKVAAKRAIVHPDVASRL